MYFHTFLALMAMVLASFGAQAADSGNGLACKAEVDSAFEKLRAKGKFRLKTTITNEQGKLHLEADYILPDRMYQRVQLGDSGAPMEMIVIGKQAWSNQGQGWSELPENFSKTVATQMRESVVQPPKTMTEFKCLGEKEFEGANYDVYQGILATPLNADNENKGPRLDAVKVPNQQLVYIDKTSGLPVRNIVNPVTDPNKRLFDGSFLFLADIKIDKPNIKEN